MAERGIRDCAVALPRLRTTCLDRSSRSIGLWRRKRVWLSVNRVGKCWRPAFHYLEKKTQAQLCSLAISRKFGERFKPRAGRQSRAEAF